MAGLLRKLRYLEYLLIIVAGVFLVNMSWSWRHVSPSMERTLELVGVSLGGVLVVWHLLKFYKLLRRDTRNYIVFRSDSGSLRVQTSAIEEALRHTARSLPEVHDVRVRLVLDPQTGIPKAGEVEARIKDLTNIIAVHDTLSRVLGERYQQIIPGAPPIELHLTIKHHFRPPSEPKRREKRAVAAEEDETKAIRAPLYPIPEER